MPSKGAIAIENILKREKIDYRAEFTFQDCKDRNCLPFDFIIFINGRYAVVEFDGRQHFEMTPCFDGTNPVKAQESFGVRQYHDLIKNIYTRDNNISLLRISYREEKEIETYLIQFINALKTTSKPITIFSNSQHESYVYPYGKTGMCVIC